jgi:hypothetical protein
MDVMRGAIWGAIGGAVVELYDIVAVARATRLWPWLDPDVPHGRTTRREKLNLFGVWLLATLARVAAGSGGAAAASSQVTGDLAAFGLGVAGPLALERLLAMAQLRPAAETAPKAKRRPPRSASGTIPQASERPTLSDELGDPA